MKAGTRVELPLWLGEMLAVAGGYVLECSPKRKTIPGYLLLLMAISTITSRYAKIPAVGTRIRVVAKPRLANGSLLALNSAVRPSSL
jgi:hypothetical protein